MRPFHSKIFQLISRMIYLLLFCFLLSLPPQISATTTNGQGNDGENGAQLNGTNEKGALSENVLLIYDAHLLLADLAQIVDLEGGKYARGEKLISGNGVKVATNGKGGGGHRQQVVPDSDAISSSDVPVADDDLLHFAATLPPPFDLHKAAVAIWGKMVGARKEKKLGGGGHCFSATLKSGYLEKFGAVKMQKLLSEKFNASPSGCYGNVLAANKITLIKLFHLGIELVQEVTGEKYRHEKGQLKWDDHRREFPHSPRLLRPLAKGNRKNGKKVDDDADEYGQLARELGKYAEQLKRGLEGSQVATLNAFKNTLNRDHILVDREDTPFWRWLFSCFLPSPNDGKIDDYMRDLKNGAQLDGGIQALLRNNDRLPWSTFSAVFGRKFDSFDEIHERFHIFDKVKSMISGHNEKFHKGEASYSMGFNGLADRTDVELRQMNGYRRSEHKENFSTKMKKIKQWKKTKQSTLPAHVDWRDEGIVTGVKSQGSCGSCWAFAAIAVLESQQARMMRRDPHGDPYILSEQQCIDCSGEYGGGGCGGGWPEVCYAYMMDGDNPRKHMHGMEAEESYPYKATDGQCKYDPLKAVATIEDWDFVTAYFTTPPFDEEAMKEAVASIGPVAGCIDTSRSFGFYQSGVFYDPNCSDYNSDDYLGGHCIAIIGYGIDEKGNDYWLVKNSWGADWGDNGYIKMARNRDNNCLIANDVTFPIVSKKPAH